MKQMYIEFIKWKGKKSAFEKKETTKKPHAKALHCFYVVFVRNILDLGLDLDF